MREWELEGYKRARLQRAQMGLGTAPIGDKMYSILEDSGIFVLGRPWPEANLSGVMFRVSDTQPFVFINHSMSLGRQRFTAAHEFSHALYDRDLVSRVESASEFPASNDPKEVAANAFADEFLMPSDSPKIREVEVDILRKGARPEVIIPLQHFFGVSYKAMVRRLWKLGILSRPQWEFLREYEPLKRATLDLGYSTDLLYGTSNSYVSPCYVALACALYRKGGISEAKLESFLNDVGRTLESLDLSAGPLEENAEDYRSILTAHPDVDEGDRGPDPT